MKSYYSAYTVKLSNDPSYYGSTCQQEDADRIVRTLREMIEIEFPGINVEIFDESGDASSKTTGPNEDTIEEINCWIDENWTAAL